MKLILTVGISASGKTTWAEEQQRQQKRLFNINRDKIRFDIVQPGSNWSTYKHNKKNESKVTELEFTAAITAVDCGADIIISNTNLHCVLMF